MNDSSKKDKVILDEIKELVIKINYHDQLYYNENKQKITDTEYDALRKDLENQKLLKNESDNLMRDARDKIHGHLTEITVLKNKTRSLRNLKSESDILAKEAGGKVGDLLKKNYDLKNEVMESRTNEEKSKDSLMKEKNAELHSSGPLHQNQ